MTAGALQGVVVGDSVAGLLAAMRCSYPTDHQCGWTFDRCGKLAFHGDILVSICVALCMKMISRKGALRT